MGELNPMYGKPHSLGHRAKVSKVMMGNKRALGHCHTQEWKDYISAKTKGRKGNPQGEETKAKLRQINIGKTLSEETKVKIGIASKEHWQNYEIRAKTIKALKELWCNPAYKENQVRKICLALNIKPNKPETTLLGILQDIDSRWQFVGDGKLIIGGKNPDFWNGDHKLIELFGDYWHGERARCYEETEEGRIKLFREYGYNTLVIWERELKTPDKTLGKIQRFLRA